MSDWCLRYEGYDPRQEGLRETLCTLGNGYFATRGCAPNALADLSGDLDALRDPTQCNITDGAGKIPFICFDLAGGANMANSNVLVGQQGGQTDFLSTAGYEKMGLPGDMVPGLQDVDGNDFANFDLGLGFHFDSAFRRGILSRVSAATAANINGAVIPARSAGPAPSPSNTGRTTSAFPLPARDAANASLSGPTSTVNGFPPRSKVAVRTPPTPSWDSVAEIGRGKSTA